MKMNEKSLKGEKASDKQTKYKKNANPLHTQPQIYNYKLYKLNTVCF